jgi:hypothetical protein
MNNFSPTYACTIRRACATTSPADTLGGESTYGLTVMQFQVQLTFLVAYTTG